MSTTGGLTRDILETRVLGVLRWVVIVSLIVLTTFPFLYMALLSVRDLSAPRSSTSAPTPRC